MKTKVSGIKNLWKLPKGERAITQKKKVQSFTVQRNNFLCMLYETRIFCIAYIIDKRLSHFMNVFHTDANYPWRDYKNKCNEHIKLLLSNEYIYIYISHKSELSMIDKTLSMFVSISSSQSFVSKFSQNRERDIRRSLIALFSFIILLLCAALL